VISLPHTEWLRAYNSDLFCGAQSNKATRPGTAIRKSWQKFVKYDNLHYKRRNLIQRLFGELKN